MVESGDCVKCGWGPAPENKDSFPCRYEVETFGRAHGKTGVVTGVLSERLVFTCTCCGYEWAKPCADAKEGA